MNLLTALPTITFFIFFNFSHSQEENECANSAIPIPSLMNVTAFEDETYIDSRQITLRWAFECDEHVHLVRDYTIEYCRVGDCDKGANFTTTIVLKNYDGDAYWLEFLTPESEYKIHLSSPMVIQKYVVYGRTDFGTPEDPENLVSEFSAENPGFPILHWTIDPEYVVYFHFSILPLDTEAVSILKANLR